jgi:hypothetical protein
MDKFFIVGCPRSGTTMVQQALNRHSRIAIPPETKFFFSFYGHPWTSQVRHLRRLNADLGIRLPTPAARVAGVTAGRSFYDLMARLYVERLKKKGVVAFGEKTPEHAGHLPVIRRFFPPAKILVLVRDGRDVALSLSRAPWMPAGLYGSFVIWLYYCSVLGGAAAGEDPNVYRARYEDVVADPEGEFRGILRFLGLPYERAVAEGWGNREGVPEREYPWKARALEKITPERVGLFRRELTTAQIATLERLGGAALAARGYPLVTDGNASVSPGAVLRLTWGLGKFVARVPWHSIANEARCRLLNPGGAACPELLA